MLYTINVAMKKEIYTHALDSGQAQRIPGPIPLHTVELAGTRILLYSLLSRSIMFDKK